MSKVSSGRIIDTNVPVTANLALSVSEIPTEMIDCVQACVEAIERSCKIGCFVIDSGDEIFNEYRKNLSLSGTPGLGDKFLKWVHDHRWSLPEEDRVHITREGGTYKEFPTHSGLSSFDPSDHKFVAVANAHSKKPPILQGTDSKWWGWREPLQEIGISVVFLCEGCVKDKYQKKMGS